MSRQDDLASQADALARKNAALERLITAARENARLTRNATARARAARDGTMPSARTVYAKHNSK